MRVTEVPKSFKSLNHGDCFILDCGLKLYQWNGNKAGIFEKTKAGQLCRALDSERGGKPEVLVQEDGSEDNQFWELLGGKGEVATAVEDQDQWETSTLRSLHRLSDEGGKMTFNECKTVAKSQLDTKDVFVFDAGSQIYVWVGNGASVGEKKYAMRYAQEYTRSHNRPSYLPISMVREGKEPNSFNSAFPK